MEIGAHGQGRPCSGPMPLTRYFSPLVSDLYTVGKAGTLRRKAPVAGNIKLYNTGPCPFYRER